MILALCTCCYVYLIRFVCRLSTLPLSPLWSWVIRPGAVIHHLNSSFFFAWNHFLEYRVENSVYHSISSLCNSPVSSLPTYTIYLPGFTSWNSSVWFLGVDWYRLSCPYSRIWILFGDHRVTCIPNSCALRLGRTREPSVYNGRKSKISFGPVRYQVSILVWLHKFFCPWSFGFASRSFPS